MSSTSAPPGRIVDITQICSSFPSTPSPEIKRDSILAGLEDLLEGDVDAVVVEGQEEIGKTTLLAQFVQKNHRSVCLFVKNTSRFTYDPSIVIRDLCNQIYWHLNGEEIEAKTATDITLLLQLAYQLRGKARRNQSRYYFVIDGLESLAAQDEAAVRAIVDLLPFGVEQFKFLLTAVEGAFKTWTGGKVQFKTFPLTGFTLDDALAYFSSMKVEREFISEVYRVSKSPGYMAAVRRLIDKGTAPTELIQELPAKLPGLFELEWKPVSSGDEDLKQVLAIMAFYPGHHTVANLSTVLGIDARSLKSKIGKLSFVTRDASTHEIRYVTESHRRYATTVLAAYKSAIRDNLIEWALKNPDAEATLRLLPSYLADAERDIELLSFLSTEHLLMMVEKTQSLRASTSNAELGIATAIKLGRDADLIRFAVQESAISQLDACAVAQTELEASMAVGDADVAVALAHSAVLKQDRLRLLATIGRLQRERGLPIDPDIISQIETLLRDVDLGELGARVTDLATDLMFSQPQAAVKLLEDRARLAPEDRGVDWALAKLSIVHAIESLRNSAGLQPSSEDIQRRIKNPAALRFSRAVALLFSKYSARDVINEVEKMDSPKDKMYLLRQWTSIIRKRADIAEVVDFALKLAIRTREYTATARDYLQLATPLRYIEDTHQLATLVASFDAQRGSAEKLGPTEDFIQLQLVIATAETAISKDSADKRVLEVYYSISAITDPELQGTCLALLLSGIEAVDPTGQLKECSAIRAIAEADLESKLALLLRETADHYIVTRNIIRALAQTLPEKSLAIARRLNVAPRRNQAILDCIQEHIKRPAGSIDVDFLLKAVEQIADRGLKDRGLVAIVERLHDATEADEISSLLLKFIPILALTDTVYDPALACLSMSHAAAVLMNEGTRTSAIEPHLRTHLIERVKFVWEHMDDSAAKIDTAFQVAVILADTDREQALAFVSGARSARDQLGVDYSSPAYSYCLRLAIRAYSGLFPQKLDTPDDFQRMAFQIGRVRSQATRVFLWTDLALRFFRNEREQEGKRIVREHIRPVLANMSRLNEADWQRAVALAAPALFRAHPDTAIDDLGGLTPLTRNVAVGRAVDFILRKTPSADPFDSEGTGSKYQLSYEEAVDLCKLGQLAFNDALVYRIVESIGRSATWKHNRKQFSPEQRNEIAHKMRALIASKLPAPEFITHEGYVVLCDAEIVRMLKQKQNAWEALANRARQLPNVSDQVFVLCYLADAYDYGGKSVRSALLDEATRLAAKIPSRLDKVDRFEVIAGRAHDINQKTLMRSLLEEAMISIRRDDEEEEGNPTQRSIVDFAYRLDPDFATTLASRMDNDEARLAARKNMKTLELKKRLLDNTDEIGELDDLRAASKAAWLSLGSLNANRAETRHVRTTRDLAKLAASAPLEDAYPIFAWIIENAIQRRAQAGEAKRLVRDLFEACMLGCDLAANSVLCLPHSPRMHMPNRSVSSEDRTVIRPGERDRALDVLREWIANEADEYLKISDPYFTPVDLEILQLVLSGSPKLKLKIVTSKKQQLEKRIDWPWEDAYHRYWKEHFSEQGPPDTTVYIVGTQETYELPLHERWWISKNGRGLRIGTSFNSLGGEKTSEITRLSREETIEREIEIDALIFGQTSDRRGQKLSVSYFNLW